MWRNGWGESKSADEIATLRAQLAERDAEIERLRKHADDLFLEIRRRAVEGEDLLARLAACERERDEAREALQKIAGSHWERIGQAWTDVDDVPDLTADQAMRLARAALTPPTAKEEQP